MKTKGFTLAEVLITLTIIGVVAAMSIPSLLNSTNKQEFVVALKKHYTIMDSSFKLYLVNNGCMGDLRGCSITLSNDADLYNIFKPSLNVAKDCGNSAGRGCFPPGITYKYLNPTFLWTVLDDDTASYKIRLTDNAIISMHLLDGACSVNSSRSSRDPLLHTCGEFHIDVNGEKGPNREGRDVFDFFITSFGVYPKGMYDDSSYSDLSGNSGCDPNSINTTAVPYQALGFGCTAKILQESLMNY
jgi:prepilin-type N-terminal cleavage/methylation domain-containing protein